MRSAKNAVKHGLNSAQPVILEFETAEAWEAFRAPLVESLHPATPASLPVWERQIAEGIALTLWRQRRIPLHEAALASARVEAAEVRWEEYAHRYPEETEERLTEVLQGSITRALLHADAEAAQLIRYEAHLDRKLSRLLRELGALQKTRNYETNSPSPTKTQNYETNSAPSAETRNRETNSPSPPNAPDCKTNSLPPSQSPAEPAPSASPGTDPSSPPSLTHKTSNCETNGHALRAPESHENEEVIPSSETPARVLPLEHPSAGRAPLWSPWRGGQLDGGLLRPFTPAGVSQRPAVTRAEYLETATHN